MAKLFLRGNAKAPETGSLFIRFGDEEEGFLRIVPKCEMTLIREDGIISRERRECKTALLSS